MNSSQNIQDILFADKLEKIIDICQKCSDLFLLRSYMTVFLFMAWFASYVSKALVGLVLILQIGLQNYVQ